MYSIFWLLMFLIFLIIEIITLGLTTIWFAAGALAAFIAAFFNAGLAVQIILFTVVSVILLLVTRPLAVRYLNKSTSKTNVDELVGKRALVISDIDGVEATGEARLNGEVWIARSEDGKVISKGTTVEIVSIEGVKLIVKVVD